MLCTLQLHGWAGGNLFPHCNCSIYIEAVVRLQGAKPTCTQEKCQWTIPSYLKTLPLKDIDFTSAQGKKRKFDEAINSDDKEATGISECMITECSSGPECVTKQGKEPSESEM